MADLALPAEVPPAVRGQFDKLKALYRAGSCPGSENLADQADPQPQGSRSWRHKRVRFEIAPSELRFIVYLEGHPTDIAAP